MKKIANRRTSHTLRLCALAALLGVVAFAADAEAARPFVVGGRALRIDRPFRPGPALRHDPAPIIARTTPPKSQEVINNVSPPRVVPHYLPPEGDYTPRHYRGGVTVVAIPDSSSYVPNPATSVDLSPYSSGLPATIPGPRQATPLGLRPGTDPFRASPFDPDVTRRQGFRNF